MELTTVEMDLMKIITLFVVRKLNLVILKLNTLVQTRNVLSEVKFGKYYLKFKVAVSLMNVFFLFIFLTVTIAMIVATYQTS